MSAAINNLDFIRAIFHTLPEDALPVVLGIADDPAPKTPPASEEEKKERKARWARIKPVNGKMPYNVTSDLNTYFSIASLKKDPSGGWRRKNANAAAVHAIVLDDGGNPAKNSLTFATLPLAPSYINETSPGNGHVGYILREPAAPAAAEPLIDALAARGLTDEGAKGVVRFMRLPEGINNKLAVIEANGGEPWRCRLLEWQPDRRYTIAEIAEGYGISLEAAPRAGKGTTKGTPKNGAQAPAADPLLDWLGANGYLMDEPRGDGWVSVLCPWSEEHSTGDGGTRYASPGTGAREDGQPFDGPAFHCFHSHGDKYRTAEFLRWAEAEGFEIPVAWRRWVPATEDQSLASYGALLEQIETLKGEGKTGPVLVREIAKAMATAPLDDLEREAVTKALGKAARLPIAQVRTTVASIAVAAGVKPAFPTHAAIARAVVNSYGEYDLLFADSYLWHWDGTVWRRLDDEDVRKVVHVALQRAGVIDFEQRDVESVLRMVRTLSFRGAGIFHREEDDELRINVANGTLVFDPTFDSWTLRPPAREDYLTTRIPIKYNRDAKAPRFLRFLQEIFRDDAEPEAKGRLLLEMMGYSALAATPLEKFIILVGGGENGKSVLLKLLRYILGHDQVSAVPPQRLGEKFERAVLHGKLANIFSELPTGAGMPEDAIKAIVSGDPMTAEHKNKDPFTFAPFATLWVGTNHLPRTEDFSRGMLRRAVILHFNRAFSGTDQDKDLQRKLRREAEGVLVLMLDALADVFFRGGELIKVAECEAARDEWWREANPVFAFVSEECDREVQAAMPLRVLFEGYINWARRSRLVRTLGLVSFGKRLVDLGYAREHREDGTWIQGVGVRGVVINQAGEPEGPGAWKVRRGLT
jgi:P4 family phage/plasmid primase-like protien